MKVTDHLIDEEERGGMKKKRQGWGGRYLDGEELKFVKDCGYLLKDNCAE